MKIDGRELTPDEEEELLVTGNLIENVSRKAAQLGMTDAVKAQIEAARRKLCKTCENWGPTIEELHSHTIICPDCKRHTYANLGVNCPAGMAVAFGVIDGQARLSALS